MSKDKKKSKKNRKNDVTNAKRLEKSVYCGADDVLLNEAEVPKEFNTESSYHQSSVKNEDNEGDNEEKSDEGNETKQKPAEADKGKQISDLGTITMGRGKHLLQCITIIGQIEGHYVASAQTKTTKYEHVIPQLVAIEDDTNIEGLLIILNTVGGDVEAGLALAELVAGMKKPTVSLVLGGGHSIGVPLAVSAKKSFIAETATMTIHPVRMNGVILGVPQTLGYFYRMQDRITQFVCQNSKISAERFKKLMMNTNELVLDIGSVLDGKKAVEEGLIDEMGGLSDAIEALNKMIDKNKEKQSKEDEKA